MTEYLNTLKALWPLAAAMGALVLAGAVGIVIDNRLGGHA